MGGYPQHGGDYAGEDQKNEPIMGIIGSFQGWVGDAGDLYINGANNAGFTSISGAGFLQDRISVGGTSINIRLQKVIL